MLKSFSGLSQQMFVKPFKDMLFTIYNFAEEEFYIHNLRGLGYDCSIDDLEFMFLDRKNINDNEIVLFKNYIEELQDNKPIVDILLYRGKNGIVPIVIKPKSVELDKVFAEE